MPIAFRFAARSDVGRIRSKNDDAAYAGRYLAVVADGMGGHVGGDVASASAVIDLTHLTGQTMQQLSGFAAMMALGEFDVTQPISPSRTSGSKGST